MCDLFLFHFIGNSVCRIFWVYLQENCVRMMEWQGFFVEDSAAAVKNVKENLI